MFERFANSPRRLCLTIFLLLAAAFSPVWLLNTTAAQGGLVVVTTAADVTGAAAAVQINSSGTARWIQVIADPSNSAAIRCGDSNVSATRGLRIAAGGGYLFPPLPPDTRQSVNQNYYSLTGVYCYIAASDKAYFAWGSN